MEYIPLQHAHVTQNTSGNQKTEWEIKENITFKVLGSLPKRLLDTEVRAILKMMKEYEQSAFNTGIEFGKQKYKNVFDPKFAQLKEMHGRSIIENERLAEALDKEQNKEVVINKKKEQ